MKNNAITAGNSPQDSVTSFFSRSISDATFQKARHCFETASKGQDVPEFFFRIKGHIVCLRFAGPALASLMTPALKHLSCAPVATPNLTICLWDNASTGGQNCPLPPLFPDEPLFADASFVDDPPAIYANQRIEDGIIHMFNVNESTGLFFIPDAAKIPYNEKATPLKPILHWFTSHSGGQIVHAAAVGIDSAGALVVGRSGSGKSTVALSCLSAGMSYIGDDAVLVDSNPVVGVHSLYNSAKLEPSHSTNFPEFVKSIHNTKGRTTEKVLLMLHQEHPAHLLDWLPIKAVFLPVITGLPQTTLRETTSSQCLKALVPSTIFTLPGAGKDTFSFLSNFVKSVPSYFLELGTDLAEIPVVITEHLSRTR